MEEELNIAHVRECDHCVQLLSAHLQGVASLAESFAAVFMMDEWGKASGLLHDKGKERTSFQNYLRFVSGLDSTNKWHGEEKNHAFVGAKLAKNLLGAGASIIGYPILGHHAGLHDYVDYEESLKKEMPDEISPVQNEFRLGLPKRIMELERGTVARGLNHLVRVMFSCLVDADFLDTERFMTPENAGKRGSSYTLKDIKDKFDRYLSTLSANSTPSSLNEIRDKIQKKCLDEASKPTGFFSLSVPTGGGKTISSFAWALNHAIRNNLDRIIIAIPYTSIVTQTANTLKSIFGEGCVLEHHSDFNPENIEDENVKQALKLATENWDYPIVVTTNVQLFESIYSNAPSTCRKLHNIANSIIILDEIQSLPLEHLQPIIDALVSYHKFFNTSVLFTTASLPALRGDIILSQDKSRNLRGLESIQELIPSDWNLHEKLRRVEIEVDEGKTTIEELSSALSNHKQVLCIVNTRKIAKEIYERLPKDRNILHLSRMMCSAHIGRVIEEMKKDLLDGKPLILIATQLIEAGVDIDFPVVYRQEAGLDSILQAAGRCNREGKLTIGQVKVFRLEKKPFGSIGKATYAWDSLPRNSDWLHPEMMTKYFIQLYSRTNTFDKADIEHLLYTPEFWSFKTAAKEFKLIDADGTQSVLVNYGDSPELIAKLQESGPTYPLMRQLSRYSVNLRQSDFIHLQNAGVIDEVYPGIFYIPDPKQYDEKTGLKAQSHWQEEILIK